MLAVVACCLLSLLPTPTTPATARKDHFDFVAIPLVSFQTLAPAIARHISVANFVATAYDTSSTNCTEDNIPPFGRTITFIGKYQVQCPSRAALVSSRLLSEFKEDRGEGSRAKRRACRWVM